MKTLEQRVQALEDTHAIMNLMKRYLDGSDGGWDRLSHDGDAVAATLTEDCHWNVPGIGDLHGREAVRQLMVSFRKGMPYAYHVITNPYLEVDGDTARGNWHLRWHGTDAEGTQLWLAGVYDNTFVRTSEGWKIKTLHMKSAYMGPYAEGWEKLMRDHLIRA